MSEGAVEIDKRLARGILYEEAAKAAAGFVDQSWAKPIEALSVAATGKSLTHIAFLGTAILARCVNQRVDVFAVKERAGEGAYSARGLCHGVLVPNAPELDISLGVTGREPLNNQPYFRVERLTRDAPVRSTARGVLEMICDILDRLATASEAEARQALRGFIEVRRRHGSRYSRAIEDKVSISVDALVAAVEQLVEDASDGGRRAQAAVAGLMDVLYGRERVDARRVNDPSRSVPADVNVRRASGDGWERAVEVRDKPVSREDLYVLVSKCVGGQVDEAVMVAVAPSKALSLMPEAQSWAAERGVTLTVFSDWSNLIRQALHWGARSTLVAASELPGLIEGRLIESEVPEQALELWRRLTNPEDLSGSPSDA